MNREEPGCTLAANRRTLVTAIFLNRDEIQVLAENLDNNRFYWDEKISKFKKSENM